MGGLSLYTVLLFILSLTGWRLRRRLGYLLFLTLVVIWIISATPLVLKGVHLSNGLYSNDFGPLSYIYFGSLFLLFLITVVVLYLGHLRLKDRVKAQIDIVITSFLVVAIPALIFTAILPIFGQYDLANAGSLFAGLWVFGMAYAITKHRLFDVRLVVARSLAYTLSLALLGAIFISGTFVYTSILFRGSTLDVGTTRWVYSFLAVLLAFLSAPLKRFFDKTTTRLFYRDAYDSQEFLTAVNKVVIASVNVEVLLSNIQSIISEYLKPQFSFFDLEPTAYVARRQIGDRVEKYNRRAVLQLEQMMSQQSFDTVIIDELADDYPEIYERMRDMNISLARRLIARSAGIEQKYGLLLLGPKRSGTVYNQKDTETLRIIASELAIAVQNALQYEEIDSFNETLQDKIETATKKLRQANDKLRKLDETKDEFVSMASHQLRTPLTSVKGYLSMVLEGDGGELNDTQRQMLTQSFASAQRMVYLISDLLNLSRLNTGKFVIEASPVDLRDVVAAEIDQLHETARAREITLTYDPPEHFPTLMLDETKTHQVVMNFMDNAIYYTPAGGKIDILLRETATAIEFRVKDTGIGVSRDVQRHLFTKFYRADNARRMRPDGTGLGLFMAKKIVVAQGGAILFESEEGKGSVFGFRFQKASHAVDAHPKTEVEQPIS